MARRRIGQEDRLAWSEPRGARSLSQLGGLIDWMEIDRHLVGISASGKGKPGWPPLVLFEEQARAPAFPPADYTNRPIKPKLLHL
jgi:hypothetical protein